MPGARNRLAPGIVPGFYGVVLAALAVVLAARSLLRGAFRPGGGERTERRPGDSWLRLAAAAAVCFAFAVGLVGRLPFWLAAALFVFAFIAVFEWPLRSGLRARAWSLGGAAVLAFGFGGAVQFVFQEIFLVRLP